MKKLPFYLFIGICIGACNSKKTHTEDAAIQHADSIPAIETIVELPPLTEGEVFLKDQDIFGETVELSGTHIEGNDTFIFKPREACMVIRDRLMIMKSYEAPFYAFRYPELTYIQTIGNKGNGPDEFIYPSISPSADSHNLAYLLEGTNGNVYSLRDDLKPVFLYNIYDGKKKNWGVDEFTNIGPDKYMYVFDSKPGRGIFQVEMEGDSLWVKEIFNLTLNKNRKSTFAYIGSLAVNTQRNRMVYAYKYFKVVKFMDMEGKTVRTLNFQQKSFDDGSLKMLDGLDSNVTHYMRAIPTQDYVYITYSGRTPYEVAAESAKNNVYMFVEKYDWNGNPIRRYKLNDFSVYTTMDDKTDQLILIVYYQDDPFVIYQLDHDRFK